MSDTLKKQTHSLPFEPIAGMLSIRRRFKLTLLEHTDSAKGGRTNCGAQNNL
jgi:hypothetical protein